MVVAEIYTNMVVVGKVKVVVVVERSRHMVVAEMEKVVVEVVVMCTRMVVVGKEKVVVEEEMCRRMVVVGTVKEVAEEGGSIEPVEVVCSECWGRIYGQVVEGSIDARQVAAESGNETPEMSCE